MLPVHRIVLAEWSARNGPRIGRIPEPMAMEDPAQVADYVRAYDWGGPASPLQLHHLKELARLIRPGDTVLDLACGPGPLLLELAAIHPSCRFIGADLSRPMLGHLAASAARQGLRNIETRCEDIRSLPSLEGPVDVVISTSALHHLGSLGDVREVFALIRRRLQPDGGFFLFDFAALRSREARRICVAELARTAPALTAADYAMSLDASFATDDIFAIARDELPRPCILRRSLLADFCYSLQSPPRTNPAPAATARIAAVRRRIGPGGRVDHALLRLLRRTTVLPRPGGDRVTTGTPAPGRA